MDSPSRLLSQKKKIPVERGDGVSGGGIGGRGWFRFLVPSEVLHPHNTLGHDVILVGVQGDT